MTNNATTDMRTVLVTGASRGIGAEMARTFDAAGMRVALAARSASALAKVAAGLNNDPVVLHADLEDADGPCRLAHDALAVLGRIDVLVNNAALAWRGPTVDIHPELVDRLLHINVRAPLLLIAAVVPHMTERGSGSIINLSSVSGVVGTPKRAVYAATKGALDAATRSLAMELGAKGIRVNSIAPGVVETDLWAANRAVPGVIEDVERHIPLRRWSTPSEVADVALFLATDQSRYITGETIRVDGGMATTCDLYSGTV